jgi:hypothetical protein
MPQTCKIESGFIPIKKYDKEESASKAILLQPYIKPTNPDILVILPFFNPCNSIRLLNNLLLVQSKLKIADIPYLIMHCLFPDSHPLQHEDPSYMIVHSNSYAFLKENLANIAIERYGQDYNKFLVLDSDVIFEDPSWYDQLSSALEVADVVQPFSHACSLTHDFKRGETRQGIVHQLNTSIAEYSRGHPGYAIAFTRNYLSMQKYVEFCLVGGGDTINFSIALKKHLYSINRHCQYLYEKYVTDAEIKVSSMIGTVFHLYHNESMNRQYNTRYHILEYGIGQHNSIEDIVYKNEDGVYEWNHEVRDTMNQEILNYFSSRQDDTIIFRS